LFGVSILAAVVVFGGWHGPIPVSQILGLSVAEVGSFGWVFAQALGVANVLFKGVLGVCLMIWVRWTLPRLRIDQVMATCLKYCTPIAAAMFLGATFWQYNLPGRTFFGLGKVSAAAYDVSEGWQPAAVKPLAKPAAEPTGEADQVADGASPKANRPIVTDSTLALTGRNK